MLLEFSLTERKKNPQTKGNYYYLLDDADVKRWHDNVSRGSEVTASIWLRRIGMVHRKFGKTPKDLASMKPKEATDFLLDVVGTMEKEGKAGSYISGVLKPIKNWLAWNEITIQKKIKVRGVRPLLRFRLQLVHLTTTLLRLPLRI